MPPVSSTSLEFGGPYPPIGGTQSEPFTKEYVLKNNAVRLFARDFELDRAQIQRWVIPGMTYDEWLMPNAGTSLEKRLQTLGDELERAMFSSADFIRHVFHTAAQWNKNNPSKLRFEDMSSFERERLWTQAFTDPVFDLILHPLREAIDTTKFKKRDSFWRKQYTVMFVVAAETLYSGSCSSHPGKGYLMMSPVYRVVRKAVATRFADRPEFDWVPTRVEKVTPRKKRNLEELVDDGMFDHIPGASRKVLKKSLRETWPEESD